ncbi:MAG: hypothetical protein JSW66_17625 [Phycisphaerales bacterium]|nr:MAG: hypothetical protein JSW66_17625 [Phycisphaerales bacterium]
MTSESRKWESVKAEYLRKVEKALALVKHPRGKEVIEDVRAHLDRRFAELERQEQTWESFQTIITQMGPASDYAELLDPGVSSTPEASPRKRMWWAGFAAVAALAIVLAAKTFLNDRPVMSEAFRRILIEKLKTFDIDTAGAEDVVEAFGEPLKYVWGRQVLDGDNLPWRYVAVYPNGFHVLVVDGKVIELRHEGDGTGYVLGGKLKVGSELDEALAVLGRPREILHGQENRFEDGVLYQDIEGKRGYCYYSRADRDVRLWFADYKIAAIYVTRSDHGMTGSDKVLTKEDLPPTSTIDQNGRIVDKIDYPFVNDPEAVGAWEAVDFVADIDDFEPGAEHFGGELFLKELYFLDDGKTNWACTWTKGLVLNAGSKTASKYIIKELSGSTYMFFEWKSGDYTVRHARPKYYVLKKVPGKVYVESRTVDNLDYPFVDDPQVVGTWKSVDFVETPEEFTPGEGRWTADRLFLKELVFRPGGETPHSCKRWTRGLLLNSSSKTASRYILREIGGITYMFFEWKSGDYTLRHRDPCYYVLRKE